MVLKTIFSHRARHWFFAIATSHLATGMPMAQPTEEDRTACRQGWEASQAGKPDEALRLFDICIRDGRLTTASLARTYRNIGLTWAGSREPRKAIEAYNQALSLKPADAWDDYLNRGNAWSNLGDYARALQDYDEAFKLKPGYAVVHYNRGVVYEKQGKIDEAKTEFSVAYRLGFRSREVLERMTYHGLATTPSEPLPPDKPVASMDLFRGLIQQIADAGNERVVCFPSGASLGSVRLAVEEELQRMKVVDLPTPNQVALAMSVRLPCPFSPYREELRSATGEELQGVWIYAEASQKLKFPPRSAAWELFRNVPIKCEAVGFYPEGESRVVQIAGYKTSCPFASGADMEWMRRSPRVASWTLSKSGRLTITRTDIEGHLEEWDAFTVTKPFSSHGVSFGAGDVVTYMRKHRGNDREVASEFRHLQRLQ
ncbi:MAG: tetratricopeptide repeat protein [Comamonadaceae bacterium]|nr:MAG: tetratricopeptide repeat protein [Comamonadaceae bacterium]